MAEGMSFKICQIKAKQNLKTKKAKSCTFQSNEMSNKHFARSVPDEMLCIFCSKVQVHPIYSTMALDHELKKNGRRLAAMKDLIIVFCSIKISIEDTRCQNHLCTVH